MEEAAERPRLVIGDEEAMEEEVMVDQVGHMGLLLLQVEEVGEVDTVHRPTEEVDIHHAEAMVLLE